LLNKMKNDNRWKLLEITEENQEKFAAFSSWLLLELDVK
jgi:hypothetical protein